MSLPTRRDRSRTNRRSTHRRLFLEHLERRRLLAVATDLANITGRVFDDFTGDGFTAGEQVSGATLDLYRDDGDGQFEPGSGDPEIRMTATDASGNYAFERLPAGQYFVLQPAQSVSSQTLQRSVSPLVTITAEQVAGRLIRTIDGFDQTFQSVIDNVSDGIPVTSTAAAPEAIGGSRDLIVDRTSDIGSVQLVVNDPVSPNLLQIASEAFGSGRRVVIWDGAGDNPAVVDDTGLGTVDLTNGGEAAGLRLVIGADLPAGSAVVRLYSSDGSSTSNRFSSATLDIPQLTTQPTSVEFLPFDEFTTPTGSIGAADLTSIGAIELEVIAGPNYDALADLIGTIGPNIIPVANFTNFESIDLNLSKTSTTANPNVNQPVTFSLSLVNEGTDTATGIVVTDSLPNGITYQSNQPSTGTFNPGNGQWTIPSLSAGTTATLSLTGLLTTSTPQTNTAEVTAAEQFDVDSIPGNAATTDEDDEASATVSPQVIDLSLSKSVSDALPNVGQPVTFTLTLNNAGPSPATNVVVADTLPNGLVLTDSNPSTGTFSNATSRWTIPVLAPGIPATLTLTTTVTSSGSFTNVAEVVAADQFDTDSTPNNIGQNLDEDDEAEVSLQTPVADLSLTKTLIGSGATVGDDVTFVVTIQNAGPNAATNVQVRDVLPTGLSFVSDSTTVGDYNASTSIWTIPNVPVTGVATTPVTLTLTANLQNANVQTNSAEIIASDQFDPDSTPGNSASNEDDTDSVVVTPVTVDLSLTKTASVSRPRPGETFTYTLTVNNTSSNEATGVSVTDLLPAGIAFQSATTGESYSPGSGIWNVGSVAANSSRTIDIQAILNPNRTSPLNPINNTAEITNADQTDTDSTPDNAVASEDDQATLVLTPARADLRLNKTASGSQSNVGDEITFTISTTNDGPDPSGSLTILDSIPTGASFVRSSASIGAYNSGTGRWTIPGLTNNQTATLSIVLQTNIAGSIDNVAQIIEATLPDPDSTPGNSVASEDDQDDASIQSQAIDLSLQKEVDNPTPRVGETFRYTVSVTNSGPDTATNIVVSEAIPESISLVDSFPDSGSFVTSTRRWTIPTLAAGVTTTLRLDTRINSIAGVSPGDPINTGLTNTAEVVSVDQFDIDSTPGNANATEDDQDSATVRVAIADVSLTKTTLTPAPNVGELARFQIEVTNSGPDIATGLIIRDALPDGLSYRSDNPSDSFGDFDPSTGLWSIPSLGVGQSTSLIINADVTESGTFTNIAELIEVNQDDPDSTPDNNRIDEDDQASDSLSTPLIDLRLTKTALPARPSVGSEVTFTLTTTNDGPDTATGGVVRDTLPTGFDFISASPSSAYTRSTGLWNVGSLQNGESQQLLIIGTLTAIESFTNQAEVVLADQADRDSTPDNGFQNGEDDAVTVQINPASADLSLTKTISDAIPNVGDDVTFTLSVRNDGPDVAQSVEVLDSLPAGLSNLRSQTATGSFSSTDQTWRLGELRVGGSASLTLIATVDFDSNNTTAPVTRINSAEITNSSQRDPDSIPGNQSTNEDDDAAVEFVPQLIDLALTKTLDNIRPNLGETIEYRVTARNDGPTDATNVVVEDQLPSTLNFVSSNPESGSYERQSGRWTIPQLAAGQSVDLILQATVAPNSANIDAILRDGITNTAEVIQADQPDRDSTTGDGIGDDFASISLTLPRADLSLAKSVDSPTPDQNEFIEFLVTVENDGPDSATNVVVQESLPIGLSDVTITPLRGEYNSVTNRWTLAQLDAGQSGALQVRARVSSPDVLTNVGEIIASDQIDPDSVTGNGLLEEDDQAQVAITPRVVDVSVSAETSPDTAIEGETFELVVTVQNGQATISAAGLQITPLAVIDRPVSNASGVVVGIQIPAGLQLLNVAPNSAIFDSQTGRWQVGNLAAGESQQLTLEFLVEAQSLKTFEIEVLETNEFDLDSTAGNNIPTEDDQTTATIRPPRTLTKRLFLSR